MSIPILDTHQHLIYPSKYPYSWTDGLPPLKGNAFHIEDYLTVTKGSGITRNHFSWKPRPMTPTGMTKRNLFMNYPNNPMP